MPTTRIRARFVVGHDGADHCLLENAEVVFRGERIVHVGRRWDGPVDRELDAGNAIVGPGFIDLDALADLDSTVLAFDNQPGWAKGRIWPRSYLERGPREVYTLDEEAFKMRYAFVQLIRNGVTTAAPITSLLYRAWGETYEEFARVADIAGRLGIRAYLGPAYRSGLTYVEDDGRFGVHWDERRGREGLARAIDYVREFDGAHGGRIRGMFAPDRVETCTPELLERTAAASAELGAPVRLHCAQSVWEFDTVQRLREGRTPIEFVRDCGLLNPRSFLPHGVHLNHHSQIGRPGRDLEWLAESGASVVHCPLVMGRHGNTMESFARLRDLGINLAIGTDTFPPDILENLRVGIVLCRVAERRADACSAADFYRAATLGGARALGRDDLGRLAPGARADLTVFDLDNTHTGQLVDPIQTMILNGQRGCFTTVVVDGRFVMENGELPGVDLAELHREAQAQFDRLIASYPERSIGHPPLEAIFEPSFRVVESL